jgi:predicted enzyme related to lactoylglutathione lyase
MSVDYVFACLIVSDRDEAAQWYAGLFGRQADMLPNDAEAAWQLTGSASVYLLADPARAGQGVLTLIVGDLAAEIAAVQARGIATGPVTAIGSAGLRSVVTDPDGNAIQLTQLAYEP